MAATITLKWKCYYSTIAMLLALGTKPIPIRVGILSKNTIKTKNCNLLNHLNFYFTGIKSTEKNFSVFRLQPRSVSELNMAHHEEENQTTPTTDF